MTVGLYFIYKIYVYFGRIKKNYRIPSVVRYKLRLFKPFKVWIFNSINPVMVF